ncbi:hypothetical protein QIU18_07830 [Capnocytophaga canimorsus]|nr:hypothetical protein [Capnocytophaga canimorsus]WGU69612.1 hypothetical protein QIU18_07830 [Capnocytophaga canimorsus]
MASKTLKVVVRSEGNLEKLGYYSSYSRTLSHIEPKLVVKRAGVGTWFTNSTVPYGVNDGFNQRSAVRVGEILNPQKRTKCSGRDKIVSLSYKFFYWYRYVSRFC